MSFYLQESSHSFVPLGLSMQVASHKGEKWVQTYWPIWLGKEKNKLDYYLKANPWIFLPWCELSEDMSLSSRIIKCNTNYTNPPEIHTDLSSIPYIMFQIKHLSVKTSLISLCKPITYLGAYLNTINLSEEKKITFLTYYIGVPIT